jgi:hypothetical protein
MQHWDNILWFVLFMATQVWLRNKPMQIRKRVSVVCVVIAITCFGALMLAR